MNDESHPPWEEVEPYLTRSRQPHEVGVARAERVSAFLSKVLNTEHVVVWLRGLHGPGSDYGSCTRFLVHFTKEWSPIADGQYDLYDYTILVAVSERGPFITCDGHCYRSEPHPISEGKQIKIGLQCPEALAHSRSIANQVAQEFGLIYLNADWLYEHLLNPKQLPWDDVLATLDIDCEKPTALGVLFCETMW